MQLVGIGCPLGEYLFLGHSSVLAKRNMKREFILVRSKRGSITESILLLIMGFFHHSNSIFQMREPL